MKTLRQSIVLCAAVVLLFVNFTLLAQPASGVSASAMSANFSFIKIFGTNACTARCDVKILNDSFKESSTEGFALLDGKTRQEMDVSKFKYQMYTLPNEIDAESTSIGTSTLVAAWNNATYVAQIEDERLTDAMMSGRYLEATSEVLRKHNGLWFNDESYVISRKRDI